MTIAVEEPRKIVREEVRRVLLEAFLELVPAVDEEEQRKIERIAGKPSNYREEEFVDWRDLSIPPTGFHGDRE